MIDYLFERRPEYNENGEIVSYTLPKILWVAVFMAFSYCFKDKVMKQKGGRRTQKGA